jgi:hypothetical protein
MKKSLMVVVVLITFVSCKEKLPSNVSTALWWSNTNIESLNKVDSVIIKLSDDDINKLTPDSAFSLYASHMNYQESYDKADKELDDILKYSPQYSDHDEIKNKTNHFTITNRMSSDSGILKILTNLDKLYKRHSGY